MVKLIHKERIAEGSTRRFLDGRRNDVAPRKHMVAKFRESHHMVAKLFAIGLKGTEIAARTGYGENWLAQLHNDPAFQELLAKYRDLDTQLFLEGRDEFYSLATKNMIQAERQLSDKMDELDTEGEFLPTRELISVVADRADRFGYGKRETKFNVNVDFADALQRAIKRSGKTIEGHVTEGLGGMKTISSSERAGTEGSTPFSQDVSSSASNLESEVPHARSSLLAPSEVVPSVPQTGPMPSGVPGDLREAGHSSHEEAGQMGAVGTSQHLHAAPPSLGSAAGLTPSARSVGAPQRELVRPGAVEPRPLRRRLLG